MNQMSIGATVQSKLHQSAFSRAILLCIVWLGVWELGRLLQYTEHASIWFPAAGLTYAAMLVVGAKAIVPVAIGATFITCLMGADVNPQLSLSELIVSGLLFSLAHIFPYYLGARIVGKMIHSGRFSIPQLIVTFLVCSAAVTLLTTFAVLYVLVFTHLMVVEDITSSWLAFWIGDLAGVVVMGPLFCSLIALFHPAPKIDLSMYIGRQQMTISGTYMFKMAVTVALLTAGMFFTYFVDDRNSAFAIFFLVIPHMWIASSESAFLNTLSLAITGFFIAFWVSVLGLMDYAMVYQFAINVIAANALFGIAVPTLAAHNRELRRQVKTDSLTQAASKEYFVQRAKLEVFRSQSGNSTLSLMIFDVDHFKSVNDSLGHAKGDDALRLISNTATALLRPTDLLGRFGGDEFVAVLPDTDLASASQIAKRILSEISRISIDGHALSLSFGVAQLDSSEEFHQLFDRADKALYQAKNQGKNCVVVSSELT